MDVYLWSCAIYLLSIEGYKSEFVLTPSSDQATTGIDFNFTCIYTYTYYVILYRDDTIECAVRGFGDCRLLVCNESYSYTCNDNALVLTIPGTIDLDNLHGSSWNCRSLDVFLSNTVILYVNIPITKVNLTVIPYDKNPIAILSGSTQQFQCTTNAGRPSSRIEWYISGANITAKAFLQTDQCNSDCNETLITSSVLIYTGNMIDIGKIIYCIAENVKKQSVRSLDRRIDILYPPVIADIPDYNIIEGNTLYITPFIDANPNAMSVWWTRQNDTSYIYNGMNLTINNIQRDYGDYYKCKAMNTITIPSQSTQNKTTEVLFKVNVQYEPVISGIQDYNIEAGRTLNVTPTVDAYPPPTSIWWTRQTSIKFIYYGWNLTIINIQESDSDNYACHVMNTLTPSGLSAQNRTSITVFNINVQKKPNDDSVNSAAIGVGTGLAVIILILGAASLFVFQYRKRRMAKRKETSNSKVYESELDKPRQTSGVDNHLYNELQDLKSDGKQQNKSSERCSNTYEEFGEVKSSANDNIYENLKISTNEIQIRQKDTNLYVNLELKPSTRT